MHRVFVEEIAAAGAVQPLTAGEEEHLFKILRARSGDRVGVMDGRGSLAEADVTGGHGLVIRSCRRVEREKRRLHLWCAAPRKSKFDPLLKQAAELGVASIRPVICDRSVAKPEGSERWQALLQEACKQSGNPYLPEILPSLTLAQAVETARSQGLVICYGAVTELPEKALPQQSQDVVWLVGPEGGFSPAEEDSLKAAGALPVHLGPWILRLETAAVCGLAVLRKMLAAVVAVIVLMTCGCGRADAKKHPLMVRADRCRTNDPVRAETLYREVLTKYPRAPEVQIALATLYDESLNRPAAALFFYDEYLRNPDAGQEGRAVASAGLPGVARRLIVELEPAAAVEKELMKKEIAALRRQIEFQKKYIQSQLQRMEQLKRQRKIHEKISI